MQSKWNIYNLDCAGCANALQLKLSSISGVNEVSVNFITKTVILDINKENSEEILNNVFKSVKEFQGDLVLEKFKRTYSKQDKKQIFDFCLIAISVLFLILSLIVPNKICRHVFFAISYITASYNIIIKAFKGLIKGKMLDENFLMLIATCGAIYLNQLLEAVSVVLLYKIGEYLQDFAINKSRSSIQGLIAIKPEHANLCLDNNCQMQVTLEKVDVGDLIVVKSGEKFALDGIIVDGETSVDCSMLTGESKPIAKRKGDEVLAGCVNIGNLVYVQVTKTDEESAVSKILNAIENSSLKKAKSEKFITRFAHIYTPVIVGIALLLFLPMIWGVSFNSCLTRALTFLVVSCPCALVISVPLTFFANLGLASKNGVLVKGSTHLEKFEKVNAVIFDKTGTLTVGKFDIINIVNKGLIGKEKLLELMAHCESYSNHPVAQSILNRYNGKIDKSRIKNYKELTGKGISCEIDNKQMLVGNFTLMQSNNIKVQPVQSYGSIVYVAIDNKYSGYIELADKIKETSTQTISDLKKLGKHVYILSGDTSETALKVAKQLGIEKDYVYSELLPQQKLDKVEEIINKNKSICYVGDGVNDAPSIARADVSVVMGAIASSGVIELADVVIMDDNPYKLVQMQKISKQTNLTVKQNIIFSLSIKIIVLILAGFGIYTNMWLAVFSDVGVSIIAIINSMKNYLFKRKK